MASTATPAAATVARKGVSLFVPHGGGPMPVLGDPSHKDLTKWLKAYPKKLPKFSSIVVISAHWEASVPTITSAPSHSLLYDYGGFPRESYELKYPAPGNPELANRIAGLFTKSNIPNKLEAKRGWDHGVFIPLLLMYPEANIPVVQVSLAYGLDPDLHIKMGEALAPLLEDDILILGSGFTFHNMGAFFGSAGSPKGPNGSFEAFLKETISSEGLSDAERTARLVDWAKAPGARYCHPREEHLLPLHVCFGAGGCTRAEIAADLNMMGISTTGYKW